MNLNLRACNRATILREQANLHRVSVEEVEGGGTLIDCGISAKGGWSAGLELARICLSDLADISIVPGELAGRPCPQLQVTTDHPIAACLASQYAGWAVSEGKFFAMGSGPMRAAYGHEKIFSSIGFVERADQVVGVLEGRKKPTAEVYAKIAKACQVDPSQVLLLIAPTASIAGNLQIVARSVETALHKLAELGFDLQRIVSGFGSAPIPPVAHKDIIGIGRTNDSILYGTHVILHVTGDDQSLSQIGPRIPSSASHDYGEPFANIFARYNNDFYKVDPHLFSPAMVTFQNLDTGSTQVFGKIAPETLTQSFYA